MLRKLNLLLYGGVDVSTNKPYIKILAFTFLVVISASISFSETLPDNYNGLKWGTDISKLPGFKLTKKVEGDNVYKKVGESMKVEERTATKINYWTEKNKLQSVSITFDNRTCLEIYERLVDRYGKEDDMKTNDYTMTVDTKAEWHGEVTTLSLYESKSRASGKTRKKFPDYCIISYIHEKNNRD